MPFLPQNVALKTAELKTARAKADTRSNEGWQDAIGLMLALPLSLAGTMFLAYLIYAGSNAGL